MFYTFHTTVHALPGNHEPGPVVQARGVDCRTLALDPASLRIPCGCSFEDAAAALTALPRMFVEPDGSFVWVSPAGEPSWQVDGNLYDRDASLIFVDLKGKCPAERFDDLLRVFGWPQTPLVFQLVHEAVFLDEAEFRRVASA